MPVMLWQTVSESVKASVALSLAFYSVIAKMLSLLNAVIYIHSWLLINEGEEEDDDEDDEGYIFLFVEQTERTQKVKAKSHEKEKKKFWCFLCPCSPWFS